MTQLWSNKILEGGGSKAGPRPVGETDSSQAMGLSLVPWLLGMVLLRTDQPASLYIDSPKSINSPTQYKFISYSFNSCRWVNLIGRAALSNLQSHLTWPDSFHIAALLSSRTVLLQVWYPYHRHQLFTRGLVRNAPTQPDSGPTRSEMLGVRSYKLCFN